MMRSYISQHPRYKNSIAWRDRCQRMPTNQVVAIYNKFLQQNYTKIERDMQAEKSKPELYHQINIFEYMEGKKKMMDAKRFLWEHQRMCDHYDDCDDCPLSDICGKISLNLQLTEIEKIVDTVEKWTDGHEKVTRLDLFKEKNMDEREMTKEQAKQTIEGFTAFMRGVFNNPNLYVPEELAERFGVSEEFRNKTSECKMTKFEALCKVLDNFIYEQGAELDKEMLEYFMVGFNLGRAETKCVFLKCPENDGCEKCKYKDFWTKEVGY